MTVIRISDHARDQMDKRGAVEAEVIAAIEEGEPEPARRGRTLHGKNFTFDRQWREQHYTGC